MFETQSRFAARLIFILASAILTSCSATYNADVALNDEGIVARVLGDNGLSRALWGRYKAFCLYRIAVFDSKGAAVWSAYHADGLCKRMKEFSKNQINNSFVETSSPNILKRNLYYRVVLDIENGEAVGFLNGQK